MLRGDMKYRYLQWSLWAISLALQYLLLSALLLGTYKEFTAIFVYALAAALTSLVEIVVALDVGNLSRAWRDYFWIGELIRQSGLYCVVISLVLHAMPSNQKRSALIRMLIGIAFLFWAGCILVYYEPSRVSFWMTLVIRNISFCTAIVTLILWFVLIASETRDPRLLMITGGLGVQVTGEAIGQSLRNLSRSTVLAGSLITVFGYFLCLYIWWRALQPGYGARLDPPVLTSTTIQE
jgi:hypothetical protein